MKRVFLIVLDSCGAGEMPDAAAFGDHDCNTLLRISKSEKFSAVNMCKLGLGNIDGLSFLGREPQPTAAVARMAERSRGKDTTIGHWEIAGLVSAEPLPTYPHGFPSAVIDAFRQATGRGVLCNRPYSGTEVIRDFGEQHVKTGDLIVYTSADSVFQIAAHEDVVPLETLYGYCEAARKILCGKHAVGRVIARPFAGSAPDFYRTKNRRDFSLAPPKETMLDAISAAGEEVIAVGKISDIFAGRGVTKAVHTHDNTEGMDFALLTSSISTCFTGIGRMSTAMPRRLRLLTAFCRSSSKSCKRRTSCSSPPITAVTPATTAPITRGNIRRFCCAALPYSRKISAHGAPFPTSRRR